MKRTKGKHDLNFILIFLILVLSACSQSPEFDLYDGRALRIAVVGEPPKIKEKQVNFNEISFDKLTSK